jgi:hypothetical protein
MAKQTRSVSLSSKGLQRLGTNFYENDFKFFVGSDEYFCPSFITDFLSPRITEMRCSDATVSELRIEVEDPKRYFSLVVSIGYGSSVDLNSEQESFVTSISRLVSDRLSSSKEEVKGVSQLTDAGLRENGRGCGV